MFHHQLDALSLALRTRPEVITEAGRKVEKRSYSNPRFHRQREMAPRKRVIVILEGALIEKFVFLVADILGVTRKSSMKNG
jgi:hypothetical protein